MGFWGSPGGFGDPLWDFGVPMGLGTPHMGSLWELNGGVWPFKRGFGVPLLGFGVPGGVLGSLWGFGVPSMGFWGSL